MYYYYYTELKSICNRLGRMWIRPQKIHSPDCINE